MKVKNIMFSGAMASILMIGGAYAADLDPTALTTVSFVKGGVNHAIDTAVTNISASGSLVGYTATTDATSGRKVGTISLDTDLAKYNNDNSKFVNETDMGTAIKNVTDVIGTGFSSSSTVASAIASNASAISALQSAVGESDEALGTRVDELETKVGSSSVADQISTALTGYTTTAGLNTLLDGKANAATTYSKTDVDGLISNEVSRANNAYDTKGAAATAKSEAITAVQGDTSETVASVDAKVAAINAEGTGILAQAQTYADGKASAAETAAKNYADGLADNYDAAGAAKAVQGNTTETVADVAADIVELQAAIEDKQGTLTGSTYIDITGDTVSVKNIATSWE